MGVYIVGAGMAGTLTGLILSQYVKEDVIIIGPQKEPMRLGPQFLWNGIHTEVVLKSLNLPTNLKLVQCGYWSQGTGWMKQPTDKMVQQYRAKTNRAAETNAKVMSDGLSNFVAYDVSFEQLWTAARKESERRGVTRDEGMVVGMTAGKSAIIKPLGVVKTIVSENATYNIESSDVVIVTIPLREVQKMLGHSVITEYGLVGYKDLSTKELPFEVERMTNKGGFDYVYVSHRSWPYYRVSYDRGFNETLIGETDVQNLPNVRYYQTQTTGRFRTLPVGNVAQLGRMARGDRSRMHDTIHLAFHLVDEFHRRGSGSWIEVIGAIDGGIA